MTRHTYRVVQAFDSVGADGLQRFAVGQLLTLDRPAKPSQHLELLADGEPEPVRDLAAELVLAEQRIAELGASLDQLGADAAADRKAAEDAITAKAKAEAEAAKLAEQVADLTAKLADAEAALAAAKAAAVAEPKGKASK